MYDDEVLLCIDKAEIFSMEACAKSLESLTAVIGKFVEFMKVGFNCSDVSIISVLLT